jgi:Carbohydrate-selective porin, OprB family/S-layer homology domain
MRTRTLMGTLAGTISFSLASSALAQDDAAMMEQYAKDPDLGHVSQINSVSELSDVDPNQWAFQALKSLVERYGCIEGFPNKKYLGNRVLTRYEFAAGLNSCLDKVSELLTAATDPLATRDDLAVVQRLQEEFKTELTILRGRVDALEAKTKELEAYQFSTTTKLDGSVIMAVQGGSAGGNVSISASALGIPTGIVGSSAANTTFFGRTTLNLRTSFTGKDELLIRLRGVTGQDISGTFPGIASGLGTAFYGGGNNGSFDGSTPNVQTNGNATVSFDKIRYTTTLFRDNFRVFVGPRIELSEIIDTNSFADNEEVDFSSGFFINNPLITFTTFGPGAGADWKISDQFSLRAVYIAGQGGRSFGFGQGGLTGSDTIGSAELEFHPSQTSKIKLQYSGYTTNTFPSPLGITGTQKTDVFGVNAEWAITPNVAIFGRYGTGTTKNYNPGFVGLTPVPAGDYTLSTWQLGLAFPDLFAPGNTLGIAVGQPNKVTSGPITASGTETDYELYYNLKINDRITLTPDVQIISQPNNIAGNPTIAVGTLRLVFAF